MKKLSFLLLLLIPARLHAIHTIIFTNASNLTTGTVSDALLSVNVTTQGNTFNSANQLARYDATGNLANTFSAFDEGSFLNRGSSINCVGSGITCSQSGQTTIMTVAGATAGVSGSYSAIIGTSTARNPTYIGTSSVPLITAIFDICGASNATTCAQNTSIFVQNGVYAWYGTTVPKGVNLVFESSAVITNNLLNRNILTLYGKITDSNWDVTEANAATVPFIEYKTGARHFGGRIYNLGYNSTTSSTTFSRIQNASDVKIIGVEYSSPTTAGANIFNTLVIDNSTDVWFQRNKLYPNTTAGGTDSQIYIKGGDNINITDNDVATRGLFLYAEAYKKLGRLNIARNVISAAVVDGAAGLISIQTGVGGAIVDTGTAITENVLNITDAGVNRNIITLNDGGGILNIFNVIISNNYAKGVVGNSLTFCKTFHTTEKNTILKGNTTAGISTFLTDSGTATQSATLGNFKDAIQQ